MPEVSIMTADRAGEGRPGWIRHLRFDRTLLRRRGAALTLTIIVHIILLLMVLFSRSVQVVRKEDDGLVTFSVMPDPAKKAPGDKKPKKTKAAVQSASEPAPAPRPAEEAPKAAAPKVAETPPFLQMSRDDFAASDIGRLPSRGAGVSDGGGKGNSAAVAGPGEGPGGVQLFQAEWYRKPTDAELATYMPSDPPREGWGLVACKTIENYHVENCQSLGESPLGSGFAKAVRQAAWQFLVRPPRIDGKPQVGAWVRIRIDYTQGVALAN